MEQTNLTGAPSRRPAVVVAASAAASSQDGRRSPRRRHHGQRLAVTTSFGGPQFQGLGIGLSSQTPNSTSSLSSPFSQIATSSSYTSVSPAGASRANSPMAPRPLFSFNAPYNPQEWAPIAGRSSHHGAQHSRLSTQSTRSIAAARTNSGGEDGIDSPPPPYSPRPSTQQLSVPRSALDLEREMTSSSSNPSHCRTIIGDSPTLFSSPTTEQQSAAPRQRPQSLVLSWEKRASSFPLPPPPPVPPQENQARSSSSHPSDRRQTFFGFSQLAPSSRGGPNSSNEPNAIEILQQNTAEALAQPLSRPPAAMRAASTGAINYNLHNNPSLANDNRSRSPNAWEPGMPLPPPPPRPPMPHNLRTRNSLDVHEGAPFLCVPTPESRRPPAHGTALDQIPLTPADWIEGSAASSRGVDKLPVDVTLAGGSGCGNDDRKSARKKVSDSSAYLYRSPAIRDPSAKGIRERRSESRQGRRETFTQRQNIDRGSNLPSRSNEIVPADLDLSSVDRFRRRTATRSSTGSSESSDYRLKSPALRNISGEISAHSSSSTPKADSRPENVQKTSAPTPPFSPDRRNFKIPPPSAVPPKALPTPPFPEYGEFSSPSCTPARPIFRLLHTPIAENIKPSPLIPSRPGSNLSNKSDEIWLEDEFVSAAVERYTRFLKQEDSALDERHKMDSFIDFLIIEYNLRRQRYKNLFADGNYHAKDELFCKLFDSTDSPLPTPREQVQTQDSQENPSTANTTSSETIQVRVQQEDSIPQSPSASRCRPESGWWSSYMPSLSPIASMSISTGLDEMDSRGRAPSRWWESQESASDGNGNRRKVERERGEAKYMSLNPDMFGNLQHPPEAGFDIGQGQVKGQGQGQARYDGNAYAPSADEKRDLCAFVEDDCFAASGSHASACPPPAFTSGNTRPQPLDVSRLITLPPPYPRHYPALSNAHPLLSSLRSVVRTATSLSEPAALQSTYAASRARVVATQTRESQNRASNFRAHISGRVASSALTFSEAARREAEFTASEHSISLKQAQGDYDVYTTTVFVPLQSLYNQTLNSVASAFSTLSASIASKSRTPSSVVEEGDATPSLLEELTLLKWLFDARESLHRSLYGITATRTEKYKDLCVLPYRQAQNDAKASSASEFFARDARDREIKYLDAALARYEEYTALVSSQVASALETQLSLFFDIASPLSDLLSRIPQNLSDFSVVIPATAIAQSEEDRVRYERCNLLYLVDLLRHAHKAVYQVVESQINLTCLEQGVQESLVHARNALATARARVEGDDAAMVRLEAELRGEEAGLTVGLKDKVREIEGLWTDALGRALDEVKDRVRAFIEDAGAWDDDEAE